jgi:hypothetical protein
MALNALLNKLCKEENQRGRKGNLQPIFDPLWEPDLLSSPQLQYSWRRNMLIQGSSCVCSLGEHMELRGERRGEIVESLVGNFKDFE